MTPQLQEYANQDIGYRQFCDQYKLAAADPATRKEYYLWFDFQMTQAGIKMAGERIGREEGRQEGLLKGRQEERQRADKEKREMLSGNIRRMTSIGMEDAAIAEILDLPVSEINKYR